jgi:tetratricopeptide (TPR) repeat protein
MVHLKAEKGDATEAERLTEMMFGMMIDDSCLLNSLNYNGFCKNPLVQSALLLYSGKIDEALSNILQAEPGINALYVQSRALSLLGRFDEADEVNSRLAKIIEGKPLDPKVYFQIAVTNAELGDPWFGILQRLIKEYPNYDKAVLKMRSLMLHNNMPLIYEATEDDSDALTAFNDTAISAKDYAQMLSESKNRKDLRKIILNQTLE